MNKFKRIFFCFPQIKQIKQIYKNNEKLYRKYLHNLQNPRENNITSIGTDFSPLHIKELIRYSIEMGFSPFKNEKNPQALAKT